MEISKVTILIWDDPLNYNLPETQRQFGNGKLYKNVIQFNTEEEFEKILKSLDDDVNIVVCCHVKYSDFSTFFDFKNSGIIEKYNISEAIYLSSGESGTIMKSLHDIYKISKKVILYNELIKEIKLDEIKTITKAELLNLDSSGKKLESVHIDRPSQHYPQIDYGIITALYEDEFEEVQKVFEFDEKDIIRTDKKEYHIGHLKSNPSKKVVVAIPSATGMVDSAIIATQMLEFFKPKYLLMSGVCGGKSDLSFGTIVVAETIFTFQKGKVSDILLKDEKGDKKPVDLYDAEGKLVEYDKLYDANGRQIGISVEKFDVQHDSIIEIHSLVKDGIRRKKEEIKALINNELSSFSKSIDIILAPMACSSMVINKRGYFEDNIKIVDRNTSAVEMESYGVARACEFANNGKTIPIIFKSVMDNMSAKDDTAKRFAAHTSSLFLKYLFEKNII
ncbi:hypothetical protein [Pedobacter psychrodurus]|uniref:5'-methylthioadenosine/S-adenosylhomocysteine nucleosidase family protein n=1 Tax=Pedobacter psychrodurus TaxID=2530456 RepID=UPI0029315C29|nr:hypothetical protein [Pedobacter psychrodurus]